MLFFTAFLSALVGVPLVALVILAALVLKLWGMIAVFCWLGGAVRRAVRRGVRLHQTAVLQNVVVGLMILGVLKLVPWLGIWVWTAATLIGVGASLTTKFGRQEAWLEGG